MLYRRHDQTSAGAWELVSFLPGDVVGCAPQPPVEAAGALLARYHAAAGQVQPASQRPIALPLARVPALLASAGTHARGEDDQMRLIWRLARELAADLGRIGHPRLPQLVIHGDFTSHNVVAAGRPPPAVRRHRLRARAPGVAGGLVGCRQNGIFAADQAFASSH